VKLCKTATKRAPEWARGWSMLGAALVEAGRLPAALNAYTRALDCTRDSLPGSGTGDPDDTAWQVRAGMGKIHLALEEYEEAAACLTDAVSRNPGDAELRVWLARAQEALGRSGDARHQLERAIAVSHGGPEAFIGLSDFFTSKAEAALIRGLADNSESRALLERIERLRAARATS
jgi:Flp pilus assembly protein TadD